MKTFSKHMNKTIWMCWFQGEDDLNMPHLNKVCIKKWKELNKDWNVIVLNSQTISDYIPNFQEILNDSPKREHSHCADLLRLLLLSKYGGVWVDCNVYPVSPLSDFYEEVVNTTGFFTYRFFPRYLNKKMGNRETVVWFLCANAPKNYLIEMWKQKLIKKFRDNHVWKYYTMAETLCELYDTDLKIKFIIDNMVQIDEKIPHSAGKTNRKRKWLNSYIYKRPNGHF